MRIDRIKLAAEMIRADLNGKQLAEKAGISRVTMASIKSGKSCAPQTAIDIATALNVSIEQLLPDNHSV